MRKSTPIKSCLWCRLHLITNEDRLQTGRCSLCVCGFHEDTQTDRWRERCDFSSVQACCFFWVPLSLLLTVCWRLRLERECDWICQKRANQMSPEEVFRWDISHLWCDLPKAKLSPIDGKSRSTSRAVRGDCVISFRCSSFSQSCFSVRASQMYKTLPAGIRNCATYLTCTQSVQAWLLKSHHCTVYLHVWKDGRGQYCISCVFFPCCLPDCMQWNGSCPVFVLLLLLSLWRLVISSLCAFYL